MSHSAAVLQPLFTRPVLFVREEVGDVLELRAAVKQEARKLELQLTDLVHHYDDSFKMVWCAHVTRFQT